LEPKKVTINDVIIKLMEKERIPYKMLDGHACEYQQDYGFARIIFDEEKRELISEEDLYSTGKGWHRVISLTNMKHCASIINELLLPAGLHDKHDDGEYTLPTFSELENRINSNQSKVFYIELRKEKGYLKFERSFPIKEDGPEPPKPVESKPAEEPSTSTLRKKLANK
jgi:hypothetical protein